MQKQTRRNLFTASYIVLCAVIFIGALLTAIKAERYIYWFIPFIFLLPWLCGGVGPKILRDVEDYVRHNEKAPKDLKHFKSNQHANR